MYVSKSWVNGWTEWADFFKETLKYPRGNKGKKNLFSKIKFFKCFLILRVFLKFASTSNL